MITGKRYFRNLVLIPSDNGNGNGSCTAETINHFSGDFVKEVQFTDDNKIIVRPIYPSGYAISEEFDANEYFLEGTECPVPQQEAN